jgi:bifunctional DNA-binding transcriptional regulator/antitoxin component of YhaV-PrlF toxin-antitoxin module
MTCKINSDGQITLPKAVLDHLKVSPGGKVKFFFDQLGHVVVLPVIPISALRGIVPSNRTTGVTLEEMDQAVLEGVTERYKSAVGLPKP